MRSRVEKENEKADWIQLGIVVAVVLVVIIFYHVFCV